MKNIYNKFLLWLGIAKSFEVELCEDIIIIRRLDGSYVNNYTLSGYTIANLAELKLYDPEDSTYFIISTHDFDGALNMVLDRSEDRNESIWNITDYIYLCQQKELSFCQRDVDRTFGRAPRIIYFSKQ